MNTTPAPKISVLARSVSAEIRARLAARRLTQRDLATGAGFASHNYVSIRLRDEKPFTLDDMEQIVAYFDDPTEDVHDFIATAIKRHAEEIAYRDAPVSKVDRSTSTTA